MKSGRNWKRRYFALSGTELLFFKEKSATKPQGGIQLTKDSSVRTRKDQDKALEEKPNSFVIRTPLCPGGLYLSCDGGSAERKLWVRSLRAVIFMLAEKEAADRNITLSQTTPRNLTVSADEEHSNSRRSMLADIAVRSPSAAVESKV